MHWPHLAPPTWFTTKDARLLAIALVCVAASAAAVMIAMRWRRPSPAEVERSRRESLEANGRMTDGIIEDARLLNGNDSYADVPEVLVYRYELAGVTYHCAQDVSLLAEQVRGFHLDQPVQVRYQPGFPGNSVIVTEGWSGLRLGDRNRRN